jgi:hypothetical protein
MTFYVLSNSYGQEQEITTLNSFEAEVLALLGCYAAFIVS